MPSVFVAFYVWKSRENSWLHDTMCLLTWSCIRGKFDLQEWEDPWRKAAEKCHGDPVVFRWITLETEKSPKSWFGWEFCLCWCCFSQSVHYIYIYTHFRHVHQRKKSFIFSQSLDFDLNMKYIQPKRCGKICLAPLFFCGMYCILHPFQKCQWKVRIDIGIFIGNAIFQKLWNPLLVLIGLECKMIFKHAYAYIYILCLYMT